MLLTIAPIDAAILGLVQLLQPASAREVLEESAGTVVGKVLTEDEIRSHLERLEETRFVLRTSSDLFVVAPKSYEFITRSVDAKERDKTRSLALNRKRYT
jgi:hypothetical protein